MSESTEKTKYSDAELQEFKQLILDKIAVAEKDLEQLKARMMADDTAPTFKMLEEGASTLEKEESSQRVQRQMVYINKLKAALVRIENKTYGVCRETGKLIPRERLLAVPHATLSVEGKEIEQRRKAGRRR